MINYFRQRPLLLILLIAFLIRIVYFAAILIKNPGGIYVYDSNGYWNIAFNLKEHGVFSQSENFPLEPDYYRTPIYPLFIILSELIGPEGFSIIIFQIILSVLTCYFTFRIAKEITQSNFISNIAALIIAADIPSIVLSNLVLTETLFTFLLTMCIYFFVRYLKTKKMKQLIFAAFICGLTVLCRPISFFVPFLLSLYIFYIFRKEKRKLFLNSLLFTAIVTFSISPWFIRNKITFDHYFLSVIREHDMLNYQAASVYAELNNRPLAEAQSILRWKTFREFKGDAHKQPYEYARFIENEAIKIVFANPTILLKHQLTQITHFFLKPCRSYIDLQLGNWGIGYDTIPKNYPTYKYLFEHNSKLTIALVLFQLLVLLIIYCSILFGFIFFKQKKEYLFLTILLLLIFCFSNLTLPHVTESRFRVPVMPYLAIISAAGIYYLKEKFKKKGSVEK